MRVILSWFYFFVRQSDLIRMLNRIAHQGSYACELAGENGIFQTNGCWLNDP
jgi:hypothetical protein